MRIAIVKLSAMGDIIHAMVVLQFIKKFNHKITIDWIVEEKFKDLLDCHPQINKVISVNLKRAQNKKSIFFFINDLRKIQKLNSYDLVIDLQGLIKSAIISKIIPSRNNIGFSKDSIREPLASLLYSKTFSIGYGENVIKRNFELVKFSLGMDFDSSIMLEKSSFIFPSQSYENFNLSSSKKNVILIPGASHKSKCYSVDKFAKVAKNLDANFLIIWGNEKEKMMAEEIKALSKKVFVCEKLSLNILISLISQADLVIGGDTGPVHMAWALNIPSITLFGSTPGYRNTFNTEINKSIESESKVNPYKINKNDQSIKNIKVKDIEALSIELLTQF